MGVTLLKGWFTSQSQARGKKTNSDHSDTSSHDWLKTSPNVFKANQNLRKTWPTGGPFVDEELKLLL
jgi:hypothetical protein